jgi:hypothetical protein
MSNEESFDSKYDRVKKKLQDSILRDYPNPERKGCPGETVVRGLAERPFDPSVQNDPNWEHITHCSECYREFLEFNNAFRARARARKVRARRAVAVATILVVVAFVFLMRPQNAELAYAKVTVDIPSVTRSGDGQAPEPIMFQRRKLELTVNLPLASPEGRYELQIKQAENVLLSVGSDAKMRSGETSFTTKVDLSKFEPGAYAMEVRRVPFDWRYFPVVIR